MIQSIYAGVSGLQSFQTGIDVLSNNIANVNTTGFRGSGTEFANLFETEISTGYGGSGQQLGLGTRIAATPLDLSAGSFFQTESTTDLAIIGDDGWFGLTGGAGGDEYYTRAGNFHFDPYTTATGTSVRLANADGFFVTGTHANNTENGVLSPAIEALELNLANVDSQTTLEFPANLIYPVEPTTQVDFTGNIGVENITQSMSSTVISPQSERNNLRLQFTQTDPQPASGSTWNVVATTQTADGQTVYDTQTGLVSFDDTGALVSSTLTSIDNNGAAIDINIGTGFDGIISSAGPSVATSSSSDGTVAGDLINYTINRNGEVLSTFTNGKQSVVGKVAIYHFQNDQGLESITGTKFKASVNSGDPIFYSQNNGQVLSGTLETSNVNLETALTELIIMQRSYDATAKTVSTADQMLQNALNM